MSRALSSAAKISAKLTQGNGYGGLLSRYSHSFNLVDNQGNSNGYGVTFARGDQNYSDSRVVVNGTIFYSSSQFGASITTSFTINPDGSISGTVSGDGKAFNFSNGPIPGVFPGANYPSMPELV